MDKPHNSRACCSSRVCILNVQQVISNRRHLFHLGLQSGRLLIDVPFFAANLKAWFLEKSAWVGLKPLLTRDQVKLLKVDNVVADDARGFAEIGIEPTAMEAILEQHVAGKPNCLVQVNGEAGGLALYQPGSPEPVVLYEPPV